MKNIGGFYLKMFEFLEVKSSICLNRHVFVMEWADARPDLSHHSCFFHEIAQHNLRKSEITVFTLGIQTDRQAG